jgi:AmiR/NasT family two-component response regulator
MIIDTESPSRDVLEHIVVMGRHQPRPIVMFSDDDDTDTIGEAVRAAVSAYVVDGRDPASTTRSSANPRTALRTGAAGSKPPNWGCRS